MRRKRGTKELICWGCGKHCGAIHGTTTREVRDLSWSGYRATVIVELHRVRCPDCGLRIERVVQLPSTAPFSKRFEEVVSNLESGEPLWFGLDRKKETLDEFFKELSKRRRAQITAACVDMWAPYSLSLQQWAPHCAIV